MTDRLEKVNILFKSGCIVSVDMAHVDFVNFKAQLCKGGWVFDAFYEFPWGAICFMDVSCMELLK